MLPMLAMERKRGFADAAVVGAAAELAAVERELRLARRLKTQMAAKPTTPRHHRHPIQKLRPRRAAQPMLSKAALSAG